MFGDASGTTTPYDHSGGSDTPCAPQRMDGVWLRACPAIGGRISVGNWDVEKVAGMITACMARI